MAAYEIPNLRFSGEAGGTIARRRFVSVDAQEKIIQADGTTNVVGASAVPCVLDEVAEIYDGIVMVEAAEAIAGGDSVGSDADGKAVVVAEGVDVVGIAITNAGADGELVSVKI